MFRWSLLFTLWLVAFVHAVPAQDKQATETAAVERTRLLVQEIVAASYPELRGADIEVKTFQSDSDYFRTGFSISRFLFGRKMRYILLVNPRVFERNAPEAGIRAILAHELGHAFYFKKGKRIRLLGLVRLLSKGYAARFERWTDLQALTRGYAEGLKAYRRWLYQNVPRKKMGEKRRNYFSPEEIDAIVSAIAKQPAMQAYWFKRVPRNLAEIVNK